MPQRRWCQQFSPPVHVSMYSRHGLLGATAGFLVLLVTDIGRTISVLKTGPVKTIIVVLMVSAVLGLIQKVLAMLLHINKDMDEASDRKMI
jgi:hypothetical protein